jgi:serine/threonine protein kinase
VTQSSSFEGQGLQATLPAHEVVSQEDESARVYRLLEHIKSQSHFEERYEVRGRLAQGGMGQIYHAYDRILRREVAVKMMRESYGSEAAAIRGQFLKEARVGGRLLHPHILAVFDLGVNRSGQVYYTMRLVDGDSLQHCLDSLDKGVALVSTPLRKIVEGLVKVCHGVDYAHENRVIHLDLKPNNILVSRFNEFFVIDWGLARVDEQDDTEQLVDLYRSPEDSSMINPLENRRQVGTPAYMAPEQVEGDYESFDASTDVYGLGGILYFVLYGQPPNRGQSLQHILAASAEPKKTGKLRQGILPRGKRVKREVKDAIAALEAICLKAIEPDKAKRFPDAEKMLVELNEWLSNTTDPPVGI